MKVKLKDEAEHKLSSLSTRTYPAGWAGTVPDDVGQGWIDAGLAERIVPELVPVPRTEPPAAKGGKTKSGKAKS